MDGRKGDGRWRQMESERGQKMGTRGAQELGRSSFNKQRSDLKMIREKMETSRERGSAKPRKHESRERCE